MKFLCWSYTKVELSACKTREHIRTFQRYFDSLTQKASRLLFIITITVNQWILDAVWWASIQGWENIGPQAIMRKKMIFCIHKMEVERPFSCIGQFTSDEKWDKINDWNYQIDMLLPKMSRHYVGARHVFSTNEQQKDCWQPEKLRWMILNDHEIIWANICCCKSCKKLQRSMPPLDFLDFILIPKKSLERGKMNWALKKNTFSLSNYNWVSSVFGDENQDVMYTMNISFCT